MGTHSKSLQPGLLGESFSRIGRSDEGRSAATIRLSNGWTHTDDPGQASFAICSQDALRHPTLAGTSTPHRPQPFHHLRSFLRQLAITPAMGSPSPLLLDLPAANQLAPQGFVYERRQPELGALHRAVRTGWPQVKALAREGTGVSLPEFVDKAMKAYVGCGQLPNG